MTRIAIAVKETDASELRFCLSFRGLPRGASERSAGVYTIETSIPFRADVPEFARMFAAHLSPVINMVGD